MAPPAKTAKVMAKRRKFIKVDIPLIRSKIELIGNTPKDIEGRTIKLDLTRQLKGKNVEGVVKIKLEDDKPVAYPCKIKLMSYFIKRMIRKNISYVEDSFETPSQESMLIIKPFLITRKKVSRAVRRALRNKTRNWIEDYAAGRNNNEIFDEIFTNRMQKALSLNLKKTYPLSLCEIRVLEIKRDLKPEEIPKVKKTKIEKVEKKEIVEEELDQWKEIEEHRIKKAEQEIKEAQEKAVKIEKTKSKEDASKSSISKELKSQESKIPEKPLEVLDKEKKSSKKEEE